MKEVPNPAWCNPITQILSKWDYYLQAGQYNSPVYHQLREFFSLRQLLPQNIEIWTYRSANSLFLKKGRTKKPQIFCSILFLNHFRSVQSSDAPISRANSQTSFGRWTYHMRSILQIGLGVRACVVDPQLHDVSKLKSLSWAYRRDESQEERENDFP